MKRLAAISELVRLVLLIVLCVLVFMPLVSLPVQASGGGDQAIGSLEIEHRLTAIETGLANTNELVRAMVLGVGGLVLETVGRAVKAWQSRAED